MLLNSENYSHSDVLGWFFGGGKNPVEEGFVTSEDWSAYYFRDFIGMQGLYLIRNLLEQLSSRLRDEKDLWVFIEFAVPVIHASDLRAG